MYVIGIFLFLVEDFLWHAIRTMFAVLKEVIPDTQLFARPTEPL